MNSFRLATGRSHQLGRNLVANATNRLNKTRARCFGQRHAQLAHVHVDRPLADEDVIAPDTVEQLMANLDVIEAYRVGEPVPQF